MNYALRAGVHCCIANSQMAFLDVDRDVYFSLPMDVDEAVKRLIHDAKPHETDEQLLRPLVSDGLLVESTERKIQVAPAVKPARSIFRHPFPRVSPGLAAAAFTCHLWTALTLRSAPMQRIVKKLPTARPQMPLRSKHLARTDNSLLAHLSAFEATSGMISTQDQCVRSSVALVKFLRRRGYEASLFIGVRLRPFRAHAWVQSGDTVFNDELDDVLPFTPILVV